MLNIYPQIAYSACNTTVLAAGEDTTMTDILAAYITS